MEDHGAGCVCWRCSGRREVRDRTKRVEEEYRRKRYESGDPDWDKERP
jgi:hypothetical protein